MFYCCSSLTICSFCIINFLFHCIDNFSILSHVFILTPNAEEYKVEFYGWKRLIHLYFFSGNEFVLKGHISTCQHGQGRSRPDRQFFFVNNRPCDLSNGSKAINEIYHQYNRYQCISSSHHEFCSYYSTNFFDEILFIYISTM